MLVLASRRAALFVARTSNVTLTNMGTFVSAAAPSTPVDGAAVDEEGFTVGGWCTLEHLESMTRRLMMMTSLKPN